MTAEITPEGQATLDRLHEAITAHFFQLWEDADQVGGADVIVDWALVVYYQDFSTTEMGGYAVETREGMPPHTIKGLLEEGRLWVDDLYRTEDEE